MNRVVSPKSDEKRTGGPISTFSPSASDQGHSSLPPACRSLVPARALSALLRYGVAVVSAVLAIFFRAFLTPLWGNQLPFLTLYPAVLLSAWYGGRGPGLVATVLCTVAAAYFWLPPLYTLTIQSSADQLALALAMLVMLLITHLTAELRLAQEKLELRVQERTAELVKTTTALQVEIATRTQTEMRYRIMTESLSDALYMVDAAGRITFCTPALERLSGYSAEELLGRPSLDLYDPSVVSLFQERQQRAYSGIPVPPHLECELIRKDGQCVPVELAVTNFVDEGQITGRVTVARDLTARKQLEYALRTLNAELEQRVQERTADLERTNAALQKEVAERTQVEKILRESETRFAVAFGHSPLVLTVTSVQDGRLLEVNEGFVRVTGYSREEAIGRTIDELGLWVMPEQRRQRFAQLTAGQRVPDIETRFRLKNGEERIGVIGSAVVEINARLCVLSSVVDITARKAAEEALTLRAQDLARAHADLRQVAYVSAHDLQEPIRQIGLYTQTIAKRYHDALDAETQEAIAFIVEGTTRMQAQFADLLHYLEIEELGGERKTTDSDLLFRQTLEELRNLIVTNSATVTHGPLPTLKANAKQLQLVFRELLDNAVKFRNSVPPRVHVWADRDEGGWCFAVQDNGLGIDQQFMGQLFGFFRKLQRRTDYPGTGMGLAICKKIIEQHGGRIWIESRIGKGTTVYFTIADRE